MPEIDSFTVGRVPVQVAADGEATKIIVNAGGGALFYGATQNVSGSDTEIAVGASVDISRTQWVVSTTETHVLVERNRTDTEELKDIIRALIEATGSSALLTGEGPPDEEEGVVGQLYFDTEETVLYGPKGEEWGTGVSLIGPAGADGPKLAEVESKIATAIGPLATTTSVNTLTTWREEFGMGVVQYDGGKEEWPERPEGAAGVTWVADKTRTEVASETSVEKGIPPKAIDGDVEVFKAG